LLAVETKKPANADFTYIRPAKRKSEAWASDASHRQQALPVGIVWIGFDASKLGCHLGALKQSLEQGRKLLQEWAVNVILACLSNGIEAR